MFAMLQIIIGIVVAIQTAEVISLLSAPIEVKRFLVSLRGNPWIRNALHIRQIIAVILCAEMIMELSSIKATEQKEKIHEFFNYEELDRLTTQQNLFLSLSSILLAFFADKLTAVAKELNFLSSNNLALKKQAEAISSEYLRLVGDIKSPKGKQEKDECTKSTVPPLVLQQLQEKVRFLEEENESLVSKLNNVSPEGKKLKSI